MKRTQLIELANVLNEELGCNPPIATGKNVTDAKLIAGITEACDTLIDSDEEVFGQNELLATFVKEQKIDLPFAIGAGEEEDDDEDEEPQPKSKGKSKAKPQPEPEPEDEDEDEDEEDEEPQPKSKGKSKSKPEPEDDDEDEEEEQPKAKSKSKSKAKPEPEEEDENPQPKSKGKAGSKSKGIGVIATIASIIEKAGAKGVSKETILEQLVSNFPDKNKESMKNTINVQVPNRISKEKFLVLRLENGNYRKK